MPTNTLLLKLVGGQQGVIFGSLNKDFFTGKKYIFNLSSKKCNFADYVIYIYLGINVLHAQSLGNIEI
jgi:hypothetical protein